MVHGAAKYSTDNAKCGTEVLSIPRRASNDSTEVLNVTRGGSNGPHRR